MAITQFLGDAVLQSDPQVRDVIVDGASVVNNKIATINLNYKQDKLSAGPNITLDSEGNISAAMYNDTAVKDRLAAIESQESYWNAKQAAISDIGTIRYGAGLGATALQPDAITDMATKTWVEGKNYLTEHQSLDAYRTSVLQDAIDSGKQDKIDSTHKLDYSLISNTPSVPTKTSDLTNDSGFLTQHQSLASYRTAVEQDAIHDSTKQDVISDLATIRTGASAGATAVQPATLNTYATKVYVDSGLNEKQDTLTAGTNITIDENNVISASGSAENNVYIAQYGFGQYSDMKAALDAGKYVVCRFPIGEPATKTYNVPLTFDTAAQKFYGSLFESNKSFLITCINNEGWEYETTPQLQEKLIAGSNITIASDGKTISATGGNDIFIAEFNVTPYSDIKSAFDDNKTIICKYKQFPSAPISHYVPLSCYNSLEGGSFSGFIHHGGAFAGIACKNNLGWSTTDTKFLQQSEYKTDVITNDTGYYPSCKAVYDWHDSTKVNTSNVSHETWTFTLADSSTVTKEVCLWQ